MSVKTLPCQNGHVGECCFSQLKTLTVKFSLAHFSGIATLGCLALAEGWCWAALAALHCSGCTARVPSFQRALPSEPLIFRGALLSFNKTAL